MAATGWLASVETLIPEVQRLAKTCDERFQAIAFQLLLERVLKEFASPRLSEEHHPGNGDGTARVAHGTGASLSRLGMAKGDLGRLVDLETGEILVTRLGKTKSERQRKIAMLVAAFHYATEGKFRVPRTELMERCKHFDAYDSSNFTKPMKGTEAGGIRLFVEDKDDWKISGPGESFVASTIKGLLTADNGD